LKFLRKAFAAVEKDNCAYFLKNRLIFCTVDFFKEFGRSKLILILKLSLKGMTICIRLYGMIQQ
jgi:hypothetical protein